MTDGPASQACLFDTSERGRGRWNGPKAFCKVLKILLVILDGRRELLSASSRTSFVMPFATPRLEPSWMVPTDSVPLGLGAYAENYNAEIAKPIRGVDDAFIDHHGIEQRRVPSAIGRFGLHQSKQYRFHPGFVYQGC
jgi:hypothetical protein